MRTAEYDYSNLERKINAVYGNKAEFCRRTGYSKSLLSQKLSKTVGFSQTDVLNFCYWLGIPKSQIGEYFFVTKVKVS